LDWLDGLNRLNLLHWLDRLHWKRLHGMLICLASSGSVHLLGLLARGMGGLALLRRLHDL